MRAATSTRLIGVLVMAALPAMVAAQTSAPPWQRTETRDPCAEHSPLRRPLFGDTHVHTMFSLDALVLDDRNEPRDAYRFARGEAVGLPPYDALGEPTRVAQLRRPLDFTAVSDHAEGFGSEYVCLTPGLPGYDSTECEQLRDDIGTFVPSAPPVSLTSFILPQVLSPNPMLPAWCGPGGSDCRAADSVFWQAEQDAAEEFYDRSSACAFTTFVAYEWSGTPINRNLHRNVIFRNAEVPALPTSYVQEPTPQGLWARLQQDCLDAGTGCDVLAIPHNSNFSSGVMFEAKNADGTPLTAAGAATRAGFEPLVEIIQHKGESECRPGVGNTDELCAFEKVNRQTLFGPSNPAQLFQPLNYVRNALEKGLSEEARIGVNPFRLGFVGSTDTHNGTPGAVDEDDWQGHAGTGDATAAFRIQAGGNVTHDEYNPGGLMVVWAEENSRDALFAAMQRREVYATSGTRPLVRMFAGRFPTSLCERGDLVTTGYARGVPMGAEVGAVRGGESPQLAVLALRDAGTPGHPGAPLQRIQIVKGWIDAAGATHEAVFDVAGDAAGGAGVDPATCAPTGTGADTLCAVWEDPAFDPSERAFYYARVLENPTCRWSTWLCNAEGIDCDDPGSVPPAFAPCCEAPPTIQERAWTSPVWYRPETIGAVRAKLRFGPVGAGRDVLRLKARLGVALDPDVAGVTFALRDDDEIVRVTIPAGTMQRRGGKPVWKVAGPPPIRSVRLAAGADGTTVTLVTRPSDLSAAARGEHFVEVAIDSGDHRATYSRLWQGRGAVLRTR